MSVIQSIQTNGIWGPVTPIPLDAIETLASPVNYTTVVTEDFYQPNPPTMPLQKLSGVFSGNLSIPSSKLGSGVNRFPGVSSDVMTTLDPAVVRIHDYNGGSSTSKWAWAKVEATQGVYDWTVLDNVVNYYWSRNRKITYTLFGTPTWASARPTEIGAYSTGWPGASAEPSNLAYWDNWCTAIATRYAGKITHYEVWNEPNFSTFFSGTTTILSQMVRRASIAIKAVDPNAKIISPAIASLSPGGNGSAYFLDMMQASDGATGTMKDWVDVIGCHLYPINYSGMKDIPYMISNMRSNMSTLGVSNKPLWNTEFSILSPEFATLTTAQREGAIQCLLTLSLAHSSGGVDVTIWYNPDIPNNLGMTVNDAIAWNNHAALMASGITVVNILKNGQVPAVVGGTRFLWG